MQTYRLYVVDSAGALHWPSEIRAHDDLAAIAAAQTQCSEGQRMELWDQRRKLRCWGFPECPSDCH